MLTPICAAVLWSRSQSCSGGFDLRKYTAPKGNTGSAEDFSWASTHNVRSNAADNIPAQANSILFMAARILFNLRGVELRADPAALFSICPTTRPVNRPF